MLFDDGIRAGFAIIFEVDPEKTCHGVKIGVENVSMEVKSIEEKHIDDDFPFPNAGAEILKEAIGSVVIWPLTQISKADWASKDNDREKNHMGLEIQSNYAKMKLTIQIGQIGNCSAWSCILRIMKQKLHAVSL
jgi:hypothetical protein